MRQPGGGRRASWCWQALRLGAVQLMVAILGAAEPMASPPLATTAASTAAVVAPVVAAAPHAPWQIRGLEEWTWPVLILLVGAIAAWVLDRIVRRRIEAWAHQAHWQGAEILVGAMRGMVLVWMLLVAVVIACNNAPLDAHNQEIIEKVTKVLWVFSATVVASRAISGGLKLHLSHMPGVGAGSIVTNVTMLLVYVIGLLVTFQTLGIHIEPVLAAFGLGGLAVALALQDTLSNLFAGIWILIARHIRSGDYIKIDGGEDGIVADISWRNTTLRSFGNNLVVVPNVKLATSIITNYSLPERIVWIDVPLVFAYGYDLTRIEQIALAVAQELVDPSLIAPNHAPRLYLKATTDLSISAEMRLPVARFEDVFQVRHDFLLRLLERLRAERIPAPPPGAPPAPPAPPPGPAPASSAAPAAAPATPAATPGAAPPPAR